MDEKLYTGRFTRGQVEAVLHAAAPLPETRLTVADPHTGVTREATPAEVVVHRLEDVAWQIDVLARHAGDLSPSAFRARLASVVSGLDRSLKALGAGRDGSGAAMPRQLANALASGMGHREGDAEYRDFQGHQQLADTVERLAWLLASAVEALSRADRLVGSAAGSDAVEDAVMLSAAGDPVDEAIRGMLDIWTEVLGRNIGTSWDQKTRKSTGPLIRFCSACFDALGIADDAEPVTEHAIRQRIRRIVEGSR